MELSLIFLSLIMAALIGAWVILIHTIWKRFFRKPFLIRFKAIPTCKKLTKKEGAIYPTFMEYVNVSTLEWEGRYLFRKYPNVYCYIFDTSFVVFCPDNPDYYIEIPFSSILYCETYFSSQTREYFLFDSKEYYYNISFYFKYNNQVENCSFYTVPMSRRLERKYGKLLDGSDLYNYVNSNCLDKETYEYFYGRTY